MGFLTVLSQGTVLRSFNLPLFKPVQPTPHTQFREQCRLKESVEEMDTEFAKAGLEISTIGNKLEPESDVMSDPMSLVALSGVLNVAPVLGMSWPK